MSIREKETLIGSKWLGHSHGLREVQVWALPNPPFSPKSLSCLERNNYLFTNRVVYTLLHFFWFSRHYWQLCILLYPLWVAIISSYVHCVGTFIACTTMAVCSSFNCLIWKYGHLFTKEDEMKQLCLFKCKIFRM